MHQSVSDRLLKFGSKDDMKYIAEERAKQLRDNFGWQNAGVYDPQSVGGTHVIYVLHDATDPERYSLPKNPTIPGVIRCGSGCSSPCSARSRCSFSRRDRALHHLRPARGATEPPEKEAPMPASTSSSVERFDDKAATPLNTQQNHRLSRRVAAPSGIHARAALAVACSSFLRFSLLWHLSAVAVPWFTPFFGGGPLSRVMHPYFGVASSFASDCKP